MVFSPDPPIRSDSLSCTQVLVAMGVTSILLLLAAKLWLHFQPQILVPVTLTIGDSLIGICLGLGITLLSGVIYRFWPAYRKSADSYLTMVLKPLHWLDLPWLGLLPGLSEELLFRGVILPAIGFTPQGVIISAASFGILHLSSWRQWPYVIWATLIGLGLGLGVVMTHNLLVPVLAHITTNLISSLLWKWNLAKTAA
ncbi:MAG: lysostaphin resistance A-like protein [Nodosilinea sp.]